MKSLVPEPEKIVPGHGKIFIYLDYTRKNASSCLLYLSMIYP